MAELRYLRSQRIDVTIDGVAVTARPVYMRLITDAALPMSTAELWYPIQEAVGDAGSDIVVELTVEGVKSTIFTGRIDSRSATGSVIRLYLTDDYAKCGTTAVVGYRKERADRILTDVLSRADIDATYVECPHQELARFSLPQTPVVLIIGALMEALEAYGHTALDYYFDEENALHFGNRASLTRESGHAFETGGSVYTAYPDGIEVAPCPVRARRTVEIDGVRRYVWRSDMHISRRRSRLRLWVSGVPE